ncbi:MAG: cyclic nucleotide-binding domain-containing protein [Thermodesulfovibrionales bacterium]|nr:cyclic nucleotide-binding domain-containing protein [Thermodesulfovibrionales bacterium]
MKLTGKKQAQDTKKHWEAYFNALKGQEWPKALETLNAIKEIEPSNPNVYLKIGDLLQRTGQAAGAVSAYHKAACHLIESGFQHKALAIYKLILRVDPDDYETIKKSTELLMEIESSKAGASRIAGIEPAAQEQSQALSFPSYEEEATAEQPSPETDFSSWEAITLPPQAAEPAKEAEHPHVPAIFSSLTVEESEEILGRAPLRVYEAGCSAVAEGDIGGGSMFVIKTGRAKVIAHILGKKIELATLSEGDVFGEVAFLTGRPRTASVIAEDRLEAYEIDRPLVEEVIEKNPLVLEKLQDFFYSRVQDTIKKVKGK